MPLSFFHAASDQTSTRKIIALIHPDRSLSYRCCNATRFAAPRQALSGDIFTLN